MKRHLDTNGCSIEVTGRSSHSFSSHSVNGKGCILFSVSLAFSLSLSTCSPQVKGLNHSSDTNDVSHSRGERESRVNENNHTSRSVYAHQKDAKCYFSLHSPQSRHKKASSSEEVKPLTRVKLVVFIILTTFIISIVSLDATPVTRSEL